MWYIEVPHCASMVWRAVQMHNSVNVDVTGSIAIRHTTAYSVTNGSHSVAVYAYNSNYVPVRNTYTVIVVNKAIQQYSMHNAVCSTGTSTTLNMNNASTAVPATLVQEHGTSVLVLFFTVTNVQYFLGTRTSIPWTTKKIQMQTLSFFWIHNGNAFTYHFVVWYE